MRNAVPAVGRRGLLGLAIAASATATLWHPAHADTDADAILPVQHLDAALISAMQAGQNTPFAQRFTALASVIEQTFDLDAVLAASIGLRWATLPSDQQAQLLSTFRRYTIASYTANFDSYSGQTFKISPTVRAIGNGNVIVQTEILATDGSVTQLGYVMHNGSSGWKAIDVLADGSISRVAVQRSDFRQLLAGGGAPALMAGLQHKVASLSGGVLA